MRMWAKYIPAQALQEHICTGDRAELTFPTIEAAISTDKMYKCLSLFERLGLHSKQRKRDLPRGEWTRSHPENRQRYLASIQETGCTTMETEKAHATDAMTEG